ncbi:hypothetical protein [Bacteroides fluxus]|uniref:hypothetical protein n=1 Tax=Bacteroides fluxus TaxID=626930 RepID=UPI002A80A0E6|nr:hypothetical protein [Bacteroides fluxus]MDY3789692.1 hypothetical protein [Bacteroides fluxus]
MQQVVRAKNDKVVCVLIEIFFILSFTFLSYKYNLYIVWGFIPFCLLISKAVYKEAAFFVVLLITLSLFYDYYSGFGSAFRVIKTMVVLLPFFFTNILRREHYNLSKYFYLFMRLNAILVCIDFILFFLVGRTIMNFTVSGFLPRPCGLLEDSNFFSYLMLICIFYYRSLYGHYNKLFICSLLLSGSFSAIISFFVLFNVFKRISVENICRTRFKLIIILITLAIIILYDCLAINSDLVLKYISELQVSDLLKVKMASLTHRFTTISNAMSELDTMGEFLWGIGAGKTRGLSDIGLNLHNSLLQMFLEMGGVLVSIVILIIFVMLHNIKTTKYVILFCTALILGSMMETFYNPLLAFVYFISFSNTYKYNLQDTL